MHHGRYVPRGEQAVGEHGHSLYGFLKEILEPCPQGEEGEIEHRPHDEQEGGDGCPSASEHSVQALAPQVFLALRGIYHGAAAESLDVTVAHVGDGSTAVQSSLLFHLAQEMFQQVLFVVVQL